MSQTIGNAIKSVAGQSTAKGIDQVVNDVLDFLPALKPIEFKWPGV